MLSLHSWILIKSKIFAIVGSPVVLLNLSDVCGKKAAHIIIHISQWLSVCCAGL